MDKHKAPDELRQALLYYSDGSNGILYHHRLLMMKSDQEGKWIAATTTMNVQAHEITSIKVVDKGKDTPFRDEFPDENGAIYHFESKSGSRYIIKTTSGTSETENHPAVSKQYDKSTSRAGKGILKVNGSWELMEHVTPDAFRDRRQKRQTGIGRTRCLACHLGKRGTQFKSVALAMAYWMKEPKDEESLVEISRLGSSTNCDFFVKLTRHGLSMTERNSKWKLDNDIIENGLATRLRSGLEAMVMNTTKYPSKTHALEQTEQETIQDSTTKHDPFRNCDEGSPKRSL
jgi:hypothetical protein